MAQHSDFTLRVGRAGPFEIGLPVDSIYRLAGRANVRVIDLSLEGHFTPAVEIDLADGPRPSLVARIREWPCGEFAIAGLIIHDPRFRTATGIGVGSSIGDLRRAHDVRFNREEGHSVIVHALKMGFVPPDISFADSVRAVSIWMWDDPVNVKAKRCPHR